MMSAEEEEEDGGTDFVRQSAPNEEINNWTAVEIPEIYFVKN